MTNQIKPIDHDLHPRRLCIVKVYEDGHRVRVAKDLTVHDVAKWPCSPQQDGRGRYRYSQMLNSAWLERRSV